MHFDETLYDILLKLTSLLLVFLDATYGKNDESWMALSRISMLCNRAEFKAEQDNVPVLKRYIFCSYN